MIKVITDHVKNALPIKCWCDDMEENGYKQATNVSQLPFIYKHVALMSDMHLGYGMPIGGVIACENVIVPNAVGKDISCGVAFVLTNLYENDFDINQRKLWMSKIRKITPVGMKWHKEKQDDKYMNKVSESFFSAPKPVVEREYQKALLQLGTMGGNNHFQELQVVTSGKNKGRIGIMIHSGSRNIGCKVADHYNQVAVELNEKYYSTVPKNFQLSFLPFDSKEGQNYYNEMNFCVGFAKGNRRLMMDRAIESLQEIAPTTNFDKIIDINHNYAALENHFGKNVLVHRKGATRVRKDEIGLIPGDQGSRSYVVCGKGNKESFFSCSHGAGRIMGRKEAIRKLNLKDEIAKLESQGILHTIRSQKDLQEASGSYKDISKVMGNQKDLVDVVMELRTLACIKAPLKGSRK